MEKEELQQQRTEAELIASRLFRFRARRGVGVFYSLISMVPLLSFALFKLPIPHLAAMALVIGSICMIWFAARACGYRSFAQMQYSLDFLRGKNISDTGDTLISRQSLLRFAATLWPWIGFMLAEAQGLSYLAGIFLVIWSVEAVLLRIFLLSKDNGYILERKVEDYVVLAGTLLIALTVFIQAIPDWAFVLSSPVFLLSGIKSLYEAPKELATVGF